jgi:hypothetical protein
MKILVGPALAILLTGLTDVASAAPILYKNVAFDQVLAGVNTQPAGDLDIPDGAEFWSFFAVVGTKIDVFVDRQTPGYDPVLWAFSGTFADTNAFGGFIDPLDPGFIGLFDDNDPPAIPPPVFGDPHAAFKAPVTGLYTLIVTNGFSTNTGPSAYNIGLTIPEPGSLLLLGTGAAAIMLRRRRRAG